MYFALVTILAGLVLLVLDLGIEFFLTSRESRVTQVGSLMEFGLLYNLPKALSIGVLLFCIALLAQRWRHERKISLTPLVIVIAALVVNAIINYPLSAARFWIFGFMISLIWILAPLRTAIWRVAFVIAFTLMQITVFPFYSQITRGKGAVEF